MTRKTPLYDEHARLGAKIVDFAGWLMPVQYTGVIDEHRAVRAAAGLFDVSHMGQVEVAGPGATDCVQHLTTNDVKRLVDGQAQYSVVCNERGTVVDDVIVYRMNPERYMIVVNASNAAKDFAWFQSHATGRATLRNASDDYALIAFQGPLAAELLAPLADADLASIKTYCFTEGAVAGAKAIIARTGYTGEDGFEIFTSPADATPVWQALLERGKQRGVLPAGLGARDTLRLEMKYSLYGHEITEDTNPIEAGLGWVVKLDTPDDFVGKAALVDIKAGGQTRKLAGFRMTEPGIPRQGYRIIAGGRDAGFVTSGTMSPSLECAIGIGYVKADAAAEGSDISIDIRGRARKATVVKTPFYKPRQRKG
ncbi:MAG: glycine cleavage system aminomethyltransferase GcvT [Proteobacteria bacterium]|nr:glycine cleavage system aminomethyltransferase GcvT [Pseudomonadota bacterium]